MRLLTPSVLAGLSLLTGGFLLSTQARAQDICEAERAHVTVIFVGEWAGSVREGALSDLAAALGPQQMGVCEKSEGAQGAKSVSLVKVELQDEDRVSIEVDDSLTNKTVARNIRLQDSTDGASALIVAVAIDELLRATWAELSIKQEPPEPRAPAQAPGPLKVPAVTDEGESARRPSHRLALESAVDAFVEGSVFFGANILYGSSFGRAEWSAFAGPRLVRAKQASQLGQVRADAVTFGGGLGAPVIVTKTFYFGPEVAVAATHAWFRGRVGDPGEGSAEAKEFQGWALAARAGLFARVHLGGMFFGAATRVGYPVLALTVLDDSGVIGGMTGLEWSNGIAWGFGWR